MNELVSVIIPAYNAAPFIAETLACALAQSYRNLEIVVVDDGSTDATPEIVKAIACRDPRVHLHRRPNRGVAAARNVGLEQSAGAFIAPLDADDLWHPDKVAKQMAAMHEGGPRIGLVYTWSSTIDDSGHLVARNGNAAPFEGSVYQFLVMYNFLGNASTPVFPRHCVVEAGGYDQSLKARGGQGYEDLLLYLTIAERYDVALVPEFLVGYRVHSLSMSNNIPQMKVGHQLVLEAVRARHPELPERLFRWSESRNYFWLGRKSLHVSKLVPAAFLFARSVALDPAMLSEPPFREAVKHFAGRLGRRSGLTARVQDGRPKFLDLLPNEGAAARPETGSFGSRRHAYLKSLCVQVPNNRGATGQSPMPST